MADTLIPVDCRGTFPEHLFGLKAAELPPEITGWMQGLRPYYQRHGITIFRGDCRKLLQLTMNAWRTPKRVVAAVHPDQITDVGWDCLTAHGCDPSSMPSRSSMTSSTSALTRIDPGLLI